MIYTPVLYALNCGAYPDNPQGSWYNHGYQVIAMYKNDWDRLGGALNWLSFLSLTDER